MCNCNDKKIYHNYLNNCNCNQGCGCEECENCDEVKGCPVVLPDTCVFYRGSETLAYLDVNPDEDFRTILIKINDVVSQLNPTLIDFDNLNLDCFTGVNTLETFIQKTIDLVCADIDNLSNFSNSVNQSISDINNEIQILSYVTIVGLPSPIPVATFNQNIYNDIQNILSSINISGVQWDTCFTPTFTPSNIKEGFELLIGMFCSMQTSVNSYTPDNKKVRVSALDGTDGFLSEKIISDCLDVTVDTTTPSNAKLKIEPKDKFVEYTFNPSHFDINQTANTSCKESITISLASLPAAGLTSVGLDLTPATANLMDVSSSPLTSNGNLGLGFKTFNNPGVLLTTLGNLDVHHGLITSEHIDQYGINLDRLEAPSLPFSFIGSLANGKFEEVGFSNNDFFVTSGELKIKPQYNCTVFKQITNIVPILATSSVSNVDVGGISIESEILMPSQTDIKTLISLDGVLRVSGTLKVISKFTTVTDVSNDLMTGSYDVLLFDLPSCYDNTSFEINVDNKTLLESNLVLPERIRFYTMNATMYKTMGNVGVYLRIKIQSDNVDKLSDFTDYINISTSVMMPV